MLAVLNTVPSGPVLRRALDQLADESVEATANTMLFNMTGQPAMSVPLYQTAAGLPIGTQVVGRFGDEATLFPPRGPARARPALGRRAAAAHSSVGKAVTTPTGFSLARRRSRASPLRTSSVVTPTRSKPTSS